MPRNECPKKYDLTKGTSVEEVAKPQLVVSLLDLLKNDSKLKYQVGECQKDLPN